MAEASSQERTEEASPKRRTDARKKGTVAKSVDLNGAVLVVSMLFVLPHTLAMLGRAFIGGIGNAWQEMPLDLHPASMLRYTLSIAQPTGAALLPLLATAVVVAFVINLMQVGFVLSAESMKPSLSKINPLEGAKRLFSSRAAVEGLKATLKFVLFGYLAYGVIRDHWSILAGLSATPPMTAVVVTGRVLKLILIRIAIAWLVLAVADYLFQRKQTEKRLMMTKQEVKQELKEMESSPELKGARMRRAAKLARARQMAAVPTADVVITNPTHFAVALKYDSKTMFAPMVVAKGQDYTALRIRELAAEHKVPIVPDPPLARQLYKKVEVGEFVPRELFAAVAEVLAYVYRTLRGVRREQAS
ncbi:MAG: flagellar biosynthesis protein FlhB [Fimbriimonadaceae bacterium]